MLAIPGVYDAFHFAALRTGGRLAMLADALARRRLIPRLRDYLDENPADLIISVFATGASAVSMLAERYPAMSHVVYISKSTLERKQGPLRIAHLPGESQPVIFSVHGAIAEHYKVDPAKLTESHAATIDYVISATAG